mmetsp:Transcript_23893/g.74700  ORF Transcript_23893/g.74700 Transcript_23893/m.74700 type:complete len:217 (-) Transcript_23893:1971-2621(-)
MMSSAPEGGTTITSRLSLPWAVSSSPGRNAVSEPSAATASQGRPGGSNDGANGSAGAPRESSVYGRTCAGSGVALPLPGSSRPWLLASHPRREHADDQRLPPPTAPPTPPATSPATSPGPAPCGAPIGRSASHAARGSSPMLASPELPAREGASAGGVASHPAATGAESGGAPASTRPATGLAPPTAASGDRRVFSGEPSASSESSQNSSASSADR